MKLFQQPRRRKAQAICVSALVCAFFSLGLPELPSTKVTAQSGTKGTLSFVPEAAESGSYVISELNGQRVCREATPAEQQRMQATSGQGGLREIYGGRSNTRSAGQAQTGIRITLRATSQLDNFPEAKAAFIRAAQNWETQILSPISIVVDVDYGPTFFGQNYTNSNIVGQTSSSFIGLPTGYNDIRLALIAGASSAAEASLYSGLPATQLPTDLGEVTGVFSPAAIFRALGLINANADPDADQQQGLGRPPRIGFNSAFPFDFDPSNGISPSQFDFDATATHEIGHALGFSSSVGDKELNASITPSVTLFDLFRFRPGVNLTSFTNAQRILASGGTQIFFGGGVELGFSTGRSNGTGGDENQASHWKADELTGVYIGVMDPTASRGQRDQITQNDLHAFDTIGYRVRSTSARIDASPYPFDFGDAALNASKERALVVLNSGGQPLQVTGLIFDNPQFKVVSPATPFTVASNAQQNVVLHFTPTANGAQIGQLTLMSNDPIRPTLTLPLNGFGGVQPTVALTSGTAQNGSMPAPPAANDCQLDQTQYTIQVPLNATQLRVTLSGNQDIDLYARFGQRVTGVSPNWTADHVSDSPNNSETVTVTPDGSPALRAGTYYLGVTNCGPGAASYTVTASVTGGTSALAAVSAASYRGNELTSDSIASLFGQNLATDIAKGATTPLPTTLAGTTVKVRDSTGAERLAPLLFVSPGQINLLIPGGTALGTATITVTSGNGAISAGMINISSVAPGLFSANADGQSAAAAVALRVRADGSQSNEVAIRFDTGTNRFVTVPIDLGITSDQVVLSLFGTGLRNRSSLTTAGAQVGGTSAQLLFVGAQGSLVGLDQINLLLPRSLIGRGEVEVALSVDSKPSNTVRVNIK